MPVLLIAEADLPEEAYAKIADKMTPLLREANYPLRTAVTK